ncbi:phosphoribosyltransferase [Deinococcus maricopensis]|uniref:Phosphoribosyltransferase n=1 Tax=Deinococcus maricopensis (strain DSM 21211 / LMG 22137 / NRRL B-23946 / LB-34) TaxID=709986 RepID=E8UA42_DEIML|nr:phosphoribosyltransferase [Deinococcus maricopensis]ADV67931.1 phosphoribosyltransferase [Deinococcus maricopensis DSM 21211]
MFQNRQEAGRHLAALLAGQDALSGAVVLALPRGGVPVAFEVAEVLRAPLDVFVVRKLGVPGHEEVAAGAVASGGVRVWNDHVLRYFGLTVPDLAGVEARETAELARRERVYREGLPPVPTQGRTVLLVDDGLATGATMRAAVRAVRPQQPARVIVAVPVGATDTVEALRDDADDVVCVLMPDPFVAVGQAYAEFRQTTDDEVRALLARARKGERA